MKKEGWGDWVEITGFLWRLKNCLLNVFWTDGMERFKRNTRKKRQSARRGVESRLLWIVSIISVKNKTKRKQTKTSLNLSGRSTGGNNTWKDSVHGRAHHLTAQTKQFLGRIGPDHFFFFFHTRTVSFLSEHFQAHGHLCTDLLLAIISNVIRSPKRTDRITQTTV